MKWQDLRKSDNVEDVRGGSSVGPRVAGGVGIGALFIALIAGAIFGVDPSTILNGLGGGGSSAAPGGQVASAPINDEDSAFVKSILGDTEDTWNSIFEKQVGSRYPAPKCIRQR